MKETSTKSELRRIKHLLSGKSKKEGGERRRGDLTGKSWGKYNNCGKRRGRGALQKGSHREVGEDRNVTCRDKK